MQERWQSLSFYPSLFMKLIHPLGLSCVSVTAAFIPLILKSNEAQQQKTTQTSGPFCSCTLLAYCNASSSWDTWRKIDVPPTVYVLALQFCSTITSISISLFVWDYNLFIGSSGQSFSMIFSVADWCQVTLCFAKYANIHHTRESMSKNTSTTGRKS